MVRDKIRAIIGKENWKFTELLQLKELAEGLADKLLTQLTIGEKVGLVWDKEIKGGIFGRQFNELVKDWLTYEITQVFRERFESATVSFEAVPAALEALPPPPEIEQESVTFSSNTPEQDIDITKNNDEVQTRGGNVKVKRL